MSKNVAVFVDVANIFYAAKAAGVDIDYVTLLRSATANRDLVRAYAYTGLDPENENQRQFHAFLGRSGYKVISKDIRKYGDGRIKANLDIELVVDLMRMAQHLDIAVVVSGDGDFAPAIRAVQQMGVRVEVVSFRGNTSSDLIEVADVFTDISHIARVEKGARSGRRVAAEGDLSMTAVPEKETEGPQRRRRPRRGEREPVEVLAEVAADDAAAGMPGNLIVLPGERLSRAPGLDGAEDEEEADLPESADGGAGEDADGRRRRRRRGGRGRGRGRRPEGDVLPPAETAAGADPVPDEEMLEDEELLDEVPVTLPQHSTFGSVWDTQLGVPTAPAAVGVPMEDEEYEDEPEIPEYLLAERRQRGQRGAPRGGRRDRGSYRTALDRERYGRGGAPGGVPGVPTRDRQPERRDRGPRGGQRPVQPQRPVRQPSRPLASSPPPRATGGSQEPWSEVPPEVAELLLAELSRRGGTVEAPRRTDPTSPPAAAAPSDLDDDLAAAGDQPVGGFAETEPTAEDEAPAPARRTTRRRTAASPTAETAPSESATEAPAAAEESAEAPRRRTTRRATASSPTAAEPADGASADEAAAGSAVGATAEDGAPAPPTRRTTRRRTSPAEATPPPTEEGASTTGDEAAAPKPRRRSTRRVAEEALPTDEG